MENRKHKGLTLLFSLILVCTIFFSLSPTVSADDATDFATAILANPAWLIASVYTDTDGGGNSQGDVLTSLGVFVPENGTTFLALSTGIAGADPVTTSTTDPGDERGTWFGEKNPEVWQAKDEAVLVMQIDVPAGDYNNLTFDFVVLTADYPEFTSSIYADEITFTVDSPYFGTFAYSFDTDDFNYIFSSPDLAGTGFDIFAIDYVTGDPTDTSGTDWVTTTPGDYDNADAGATGWSQAQWDFPCVPGETIDFTIKIEDTKDNQVDTTILIDNVRFINSTTYENPDNHNPSVTINYPADGATYTENKWSDDHILNITISDPDVETLSQTLYGLVYVTCADINLGSTYRIWNDSVTSQYPYNFYGYGNATLEFDLREFVSWVDVNYTITVYVYDSYGGGASDVTSNTFTIGQPDGQVTNNFAFKDIIPVAGSGSGLDGMGQIRFAGQGVSFDHISDLEEDDWGSSPTKWMRIFLCDDSADKWLVTNGKSGKFYSYFNHSGGNYWHMSDDFWDDFSHGWFQPRTEYRYYAGIHDPTKSLSTANTKFHFLYDPDPFVLDFTYLWDDWVMGGTLYDDRMWSAWYDHPDYSNEGYYYGFTVDFGTYPPGASDDAVGGDETTGSDWYEETFSEAEAELGIPLQVIGSIVIITIFLFLPVVASKKYHADVPMSVYGVFFVLGVLLAFSMGFIPIWIFTVMIIVLFMILAYRLASWVRSARSTSPVAPGNGGDKT